MSDLSRRAENQERRESERGAITLRRLLAEYDDPEQLYRTAGSSSPMSWDSTARCWIVTGQPLVRAILKDRRFTSDVTAAIPAMRQTVRTTFASDAIQKQVIFADDRRQARARRAVLEELARRSDELGPLFQDGASALAERARERGEFDLVRDYATPFTLEAISLVLGAPATGPRQLEDLERWSTSYADITSGYLHARMDDVVKLGEHFRAQVAARKGVPSDDLIGAFLRDGGLDDEDDVVIQCMMAFAAGRVTTQKLLAGAIPRLIPKWEGWRAMALTNPPGLRRLGEELLRLVTPTRYVVRYALEDVRIQVEGTDADVRPGHRVVLVLEAANRDPEVFPSPHSFVADRRPNPHVTFGFGSHRCPGASIARIEIEIGLRTLLTTLRELRPHPDHPPTRDPNPNIGGFATYRCLCS